MTERTLKSDVRLLRTLVPRTVGMLARPFGTAGLVAFGLLVVALVVAIAELQPLQALLATGFPAPAPPTLTYTVARFIDTYCGGAGMAVLGVVAYGVGRWRKNDALADAALVFAAAGFWSYLITGLGQFVLADMRPRDGGALLLFGVHGHGVSGHASAASLLVSPGRDVYAREKTALTRKLIGAALLAWALFIGWSRVYLGMHHTWNVVLGLAVGFACARAATRVFTDREGPLPSRS